MSEEHVTLAEARLYLEQKRQRGRRAKHDWAVLLRRVLGGEAETSIAQELGIERDALREALRRYARRIARTRQKRAKSKETA